MLYEVQFFVVVPLRNSVEHEIVQHIQKVTGFVAVILHHAVTKSLDCIGFHTWGHDQPSNDNCEV